MMVQVPGGICGPSKSTADCETSDSNRETLVLYLLRKRDLKIEEYPKVVY